MKKSKYRVIIVYSASHDVFSECVQLLQQSFDPKKYFVKARIAAKTTVPHICASDIILFGAQYHGKEFRQGEYSELNRALSGINLSDRVSGLFSISSDKALDSLRRMVRDTGVSVVSPDLLYQPEGGKSEKSAVRGWIQKIVRAHEDRLNAGQL